MPEVRDTAVMAAEEAVRERYAAAAREAEPALCCPVSYDPRLLEAIPAEVLERDYGCGDPTPFIRPGDTVLDLGAGGGKVCFIAAQVAGPSGRVIGVDCNPEMLALARAHRPAVVQWSTGPAQLARPRLRSSGCGRTPRDPASACGSGASWSSVG